MKVILARAWSSISRRRQGVTGAVVGLFAARVALEVTSHPWSGILILVIGALAAVSGFFLSQQLDLWRWPILPLLCYVLWPRQDLTLALGAVILAALIGLLEWLASRTCSPSRRGEALADGGLFALALIVYAATAAPDVLPADAGEFQLTSALLGIAHPPGYPLYTLVGHLFIRLTSFLGGTPAHRLNLMSGVLAAGTLVLTARATRRWAERWGAAPPIPLVAGIAAALTLGSGTTFWSQATIANIRTPAVFLAALALYALACFATAPAPPAADRSLVLFSLALGLGGGHYPPLAFVSLIFIAYALLLDPRLIVQPRRWWRPLLTGLLAFSLPLAYLPIRGGMDAPLAPDGLNTWSGFLHHFLAQGFVGDMFAFANAADLPHRLALLPTLFRFQFTPLLLAAAGVSLLGLLRRDVRLFVLLVGSLALHTFITITYRAPQTVEYLMPAYLPLAVGVGLLPALFSTADEPVARSALTPLLAAIVLGTGLLNGWTHASSFADLARDRTARQTVEPLLETAPAGALILADWRWNTPLRYLQMVEGLRPDVQVQYVWPVAGQEYQDVWLAWIQDADPQQSILLTHWYEFDGYATEPWGAAFLLRPRPVMAPAASLAPVTVTFGERVELVGFQESSAPHQPGQSAEFVLAWRPTRSLDVQPSFTLRLMDVDGRVVTHTDRRLDAHVTPGAVHFERLTLPLYPTLSPGPYRVTVGVYTTTDAGFEALPSDDGAADVTLTELILAPLTDPPFTLHRLTIPFDGGPTLVGVDYDRSLPDRLRVYLRWRGPISTESAWQAQVEAADGSAGSAPLPALPAGSYQTVAVDVPGAAPGPLSVALLTPSGERGRAAGPWGWSARQIKLPTPAQDARFVPLGDEIAIVGATAHPARIGAESELLPSSAPRDVVAVDVTLVGLRPLTTDNATSVRLMDGEGNWLSTHDYQPALGAIPTLKWIRGSRVLDRHLLPLPEGYSGPLQATMLAYERFRLTPLPVMDERFGEAPLGTWTLP